MSNATVDTILDHIRVRLPGVADPVILLELFNTVDELAREALRVAPPTNPDGDAATWLASGLWVPNYQAILNGTLARLYAQANKPYASGDLAKLHFERYAAYMDLARVEGAAAPTSSYDRLLSDIRAQIPMVRDNGTALAIYNVVDKIRREALRLTPLVGSNTDPTTWLTTTQWDHCYQAVLHGTLAALYAQHNKPWAAPELVAFHAGLYAQEHDLVRVEQLASTSDITRLMDNIRVKVPGSRDNEIQLTLFSTLDDFFQGSNVWQEDIVLSVGPADTSYDVSPPAGGALLRLMATVDTNNNPVYATLSLSDMSIVLKRAPSQADTYTATVALTVTDPTLRTGVPDFPAWVLNRYREIIIDGVMGRMMSQQAKPYSSATLGVYHSRKFRAGVSRAKVESQRKNVYRAQAWAFPRYA